MSSRSSRTEGPESLPDAVVIGRVRRPHGVRGEVVVEVLSDVPGRFRPGAQVWISPLSGERRLATISRVSKPSKIIRIEFEGVRDRDAAELLRGAELEIARQSVPKAPPGSYYFFELIGCRCRDEIKGELGAVVEVVEDGGGLLLRIEYGTEELLVPFVESYLRQIDIQGRQIDVRLPEGLIETCVSRS